MSIAQDEEDSIDYEGDEGDDGSEPMTAAPAPVAAIKPKKPYVGTGRPPGRPPKTIATAGREREAHFIWGEIIRTELPAAGIGKEAVTIYISKNSGGQAQQVGQVFGNVVPGVDELYTYIVHEIHSRFRAACIYDVSFRFRGNGKPIRSGTLTLPNYDEIVNPPAYGGAGRPPPPGQNYGYPQPPPSAQYAPQPYYPASIYGQPPAGMGYAPQPQYAPQNQPPAAAPDPVGAPPPQSPVQTAEGLYLQQQLSNMRVEMQSMLREVVGVVREGRQPATPIAAPAAQPAGVGAAPAPASMEDMFVNALRRVGIGTQVQPQGAAPAVGVGAPAAQPVNVQAAAAGGLGDVVALVRTIRSLKAVMGELNEVVGSPGPLEEPEGPPAEGVAEPVGVGGPVGDGLPFDVVPIPDVTFGGHPVKYVRNRTTGEIDWQGMLLSNPGIAEKGIDAVNKLVDVVGRMSKQQGAIQVVDETPAGALEAGVSSTPSSPPPPPADSGSGNPWGL